MMRPTFRTFTAILALTLALGVNTTWVSTAWADTAPTDQDASTSLSAALQMHEDAANFADEVAALDAVRHHTVIHPESWRAAFWTSYLASQVARLIRREQGEGDIPALTAEAQSFHDRATSLLGTKVGRDASSLLVLQALLHRLDGTGEDAERQALDAAVQADPGNPSLFAYIGVGLVNEGSQNQNLSRILAGKLLLEEAQRRSEADSRPRSQTSDFGSEWIAFWLPMAEAALQEGQ